MEEIKTQGTFELDESKNSRRLYFAICLLLTCLYSLGCGESKPERVPVSGKVLIDGKPLNKGVIRFVPEQGRPSSSAILSDGTFDVASTTLGDDPIQIGVFPGHYKIEVSASEAINEETIRWHAPKKYSNFRSSGLEIDIHKPSDNLIVELTWDGLEGPIVEGPSPKEVDLGKPESTQEEDSDEPESTQEDDPNGSESSPGALDAESEHESTQEEESAEQSDNDSRE